MSKIRTSCWSHSWYTCLLQSPSIATASVWSLVPYSWTPLITNSAPQPEGGPVSWHLNTIPLLMQGTNHRCASASINKNSGDMSRLPKRLSGILKCYCWSLLYTHDCAAHESCSSMLSDSKAFFFFSYKCLLSAFCAVKHHTFIDKNRMHNSSQTVKGMTNKNKIIKKKFFIWAPFFSCHRNKQEYRGTEKCHKN